MEGPEDETTTDSEVEEIMTQSKTHNGTDDGEHKNCVDKQHLAKVLELHNNGVVMGDFAWQKQMRPDEIVLSAFVVQGIGEIKVPVSHEVGLVYPIVFINLE